MWATRSTLTLNVFGHKVQAKALNISCRFLCLDNADDDWKDFSQILQEKRRSPKINIWNIELEETGNLFNQDVLTLDDNPAMNYE